MQDVLLTSGEGVHAGDGVMVGWVRNDMGNLRSVRTQYSWPPRDKGEKKAHD